MFNYTGKCKLKEFYAWLMPSKLWNNFLIFYNVVVDLVSSTPWTVSIWSVSWSIPYAGVGSCLQMMVKQPQQSTTYYVQVWDKIQDCWQDWDACSIIISDNFRYSVQIQSSDSDWGDQRAETNGVLIKCFISAVALSNVLLMVTHSYNTISIITHTDNFNHRRDMKIRTGGACKK